MASLHQIVTSTPTPLTGISVSARYFLQNSGGINNKNLKVAIKADVADVDREGGATILYGEGYSISIETGESVFIWHNLTEDDDFYCFYDSEA